MPAGIPASGSLARKDVVSRLRWRHTVASSTALDFTYSYPFASHVSLDKGEAGLRLSTCGARREHPHFFSGRLREPRTVAEMLLVLSEVVRTHFFQPRPANLDPVVTSSEDV